MWSFCVCCVSQPILTRAQIIIFINWPLFDDVKILITGIKFWNNQSFWEWTHWSDHWLDNVLWRTKASSVRVSLSFLNWIKSNVEIFFFSADTDKGKSEYGVYLQSHRWKWQWKATSFMGDLGTCHAQQRAKEVAALSASAWLSLWSAKGLQCIIFRENPFTRWRHYCCINEQCGLWNINSLVMEH